MTKAKQTRPRLASASEPLPRLNLGAGEHWLDGFVNVDLSAGNENVDLSVMPWPFTDNSAQEIMASHILEHFTKVDGRAFLAECYRVLAPGGQLHIAVPDMDIFVACKEAGDWTAVSGYYWRDFNWFFGGDTTETRPEMRHRYVYNEDILAAAMTGAGFTAVTRRPPLDIDNPRYHAISLYMTGVK